MTNNDSTDLPDGAPPSANSGAVKSAPQNGDESSEPTVNTADASESTRDVPNSNDPHRQNARDPLVDGIKAKGHESEGTKDKEKSGSRNLDRNFKGESKEEVVRLLAEYGVNREHSEDVWKVVSQQIRHHSTYNFFFEQVGSNIGASTGDLRVDQRSDRDGDAVNKKEEQSHHPEANWPLDVFTQVENSAGEIAFLLSLASMSRAPLSLIRYASDVLTERFMTEFSKKKKKKNKRHFSPARPADQLMRAMRCELFSPRTTDEGRPPTPRVHFTSVSDDEVALIDIWNYFRLNPPWQPVYLGWLYEMGCSDHIDLRYAAGRAVGRLATTDLDFFDKTFFHPWADENESLGADALGVAFGTLCETSNEYCEWVRKTMFDWCTSNSLRKHMYVAASVASGGFGDRQPGLAMEVLTRMLKSLRFLGFELAFEAYYIWLYGRPRLIESSASIVLHQLEAIVEKDTTDPVPLLRDQIFLMLVISYDNAREKADARGFLRIIGRDHAARKSAGRIFGRLIQKAPMSAPALECLRSIVQWQVEGTDTEQRTVQALLGDIESAGAPKAGRIISRRLPAWRRSAGYRRSKSPVGQTRVL